MLPVLHNNGSIAPARSEEPISRLSTVFDRLFHDDFFSPFAVAPVRNAVPLSMWDDEDYFYVELDAPGLTEQDIDVSIQNGTLLIRGERKCERKGNGYDTRTYGRFEQQISLPTWANAENVEAKLANGVLSLAFPKRDEAKPRKIKLRSE